MQVSAYGISHIGKERKRNEDRIYVDPEGDFAIVADGIGGHAGGAEASQYVVDHLPQLIRERFFCSSKKLDEQIVIKTLTQLICKVSQKIYAIGLDDPNLQNLGSTLVLWMKYHDSFYLGYMGDSPAYFLNDSSIFCLTMEHTFANENVRMGMEKELAKKVPMASVLLRSLGATPDSMPQILRMPLKENCKWVLCSDGLSNKVSQNEIFSVVSRAEKNIEKSCKELVSLAYDRGGEDNISVVVLSVS